MTPRPSNRKPDTNLANIHSDEVPDERLPSALAPKQEIYGWKNTNIYQNMPYSRQLIESQTTGRTEVHHDSEARKLQTFKNTSPWRPPIHQWKACSQFLTSRPTTWIQTQQEFSLEDMSNSKAAKSSLKDSRTASASLTPTRLPKHLELQITSFTLASRASIPQARKKKKPTLKQNIPGSESEIYAIYADKATQPDNAIFWGFVLGWRDIGEGVRVRSRSFD